MWVTKQLMVPIDFHIILWKSMGSSTVWLHAFFKISYCVFSTRKKLIKVWNKMKFS